MADPFLALTLDAKRRIAQVASALQHPHPGGAAWGLLEVLEDVWRRKDPAVSAELLAASFGPDPRVGQMLVAFRFLAVVGESAWVLAKEEADRLLLTHKQRVAAGKARSSSAGRSAGGSFQRSTSGSPAASQRATSGGPALTPSTQHPAPSTTEEDLRTPSAPRSPKRRAPPTEPPDGTDATYKAIVDACYVLFREERGYDMDPRGTDWAALKRLRGKHEGAEIIRRFGHGVRARYKAKCSGWMDLEAKWNDCGAPEALASTAPRVGGGINSQSPEEDEEQRKWIAHLNSRGTP